MSEQQRQKQKKSTGWDAEKIRETLGKTSQELERANEATRNLEEGLRIRRVDVLTQHQEEIRKLKRRLKRQGQR